MKINNKIALAAISSAAVAGAGVSGGIAFAAPAAPTLTHGSASAKSATDALAGAKATPKLSPVRKTDQWVTVRVERAAAHREATRDAAAAADAAATTQPAAQSQPSSAQSSTGQSSTGQSSTAGGSITAGMSSFEQCVAWRESSDNPTASSAGLFGILPATWASLGYPGTAGEASVTMQKAAFAQLYAQDGTAPWAPYDGC